MGCGAIPAYLSINFCAAGCASAPLTPVPLPRCPDPSVQAPDPCGWRDAEDRLFHTCRTSRSISPFLRPSNPFPMHFLHGRRFRKCGICSTVRSSAECLRQPGTAYNTDSRYSHSVLCSANLIRFRNHLFFCFIQRLKVREGLQVILNLLFTRHTAQDHLCIGMAANPAKCPGCDAGIFIHRFELCIDIIREVCKAAALYRLHDHQRNSKLFCQSVAFIPCLFLGVHVVILNLAEIPVNGRATSSNAS